MATRAHHYTKKEIEEMWRLVVAELRKDNTVDPTKRNFWKELKLKNPTLLRTSRAYADKMKREWEEQSVYFLDVADQALLLRIFGKRMKSKQ
uniref:Myb_DNA-bind_3 domain-containing protein n=1 Tax=Steinernema glaseri TaxID=37863 RepID=A0A1I8AB83_9BILA